MTESLVAWKARLLVPCPAPAPVCGHDLFAPPQAIENGVIVCRNGAIEETGRRAPAGCRVIDLGDAALLPPVFNCHTHLQLSRAHGQTKLGAGFTAWLKSLVPHVLDLLRNGFGEDARAALQKACAQLARTGCAGAGDIGGSLPGALSACSKACAQLDLNSVHFCEHFGFAQPQSIWPDRCQSEIHQNKALQALAAPAGHALYSTSPEVLQTAHAFCRRTNRPFTFHLAESRDECQLLADGSGPLADYYRDAVLPPGWQPPGLSPLRYALKLGILSPITLAAHGVWLADDELAAFKDAGATLCLCPRSNAAINVGAAPVKKFIDQGLKLCLGTDGLSSAPDLDIRAEARFLRETCDLPWPALWKLAITNGAQALGLPIPVLAKNRAARFSVWPLPNQ